MLIPILCAVLAGCASPPPSDADLADTSFRAFTQLQSFGWRGLAEQRRYDDAAALVRRYLKIHLDDLETWQVSVLQFHEAQMLACAGDTAGALALLPGSRIIPQPKELAIDWNAMVDAVEAFLEKDRDALIMAQSKIDLRGDSPANRIEKERVAQLVSNFGRKYQFAWRPGAELEATTP
jgi:hypothetical protein